jgi:hypothetical protein
MIPTLAEDPVIRRFHISAPVCNFAGLGELRGILIRGVKSGEMLGATERGTQTSRDGSCRRRQEPRADFLHVYRVPQ